MRSPPILRNEDGASAAHGGLAVLVARDWPGREEAVKGRMLQFRRAALAFRAPCP
ncbi:hypothetical protein NSU_3905 [Novosphingobium pentaromativorans US6-1]|uniref:Uncharacterized protein n=1 Tax=Novosphingobium pentaromativorans US6-1 TaxID=1088721 RepID=G6EHT4_9SPHN|nr:hypothetical protein NSU_3905 [Novosphingobium pentaromativorans US6-1]